MNGTIITSLAFESALYHQADGREDELQEIVEHVDNLDILDLTA
jgi:hypothetical protein